MLLIKEIAMKCDVRSLSLTFKEETLIAIVYEHKLKLASIVYSAFRFVVELFGCFFSLKTINKFHKL